MRKLLFAALATISGLILLFSYRTSLDVQTPSIDAGTGGAVIAQPTPTVVPEPVVSPTDIPADVGSPPTEGTPAPDGTPSPDAAQAGDGTFTGATASTRYGPVQVQIVITNGQITSATAVQYPQGRGRTDQISAIAIPQLEAEVVNSQSAAIRLIGGATYTSNGFVNSLQDALNQAGR